MNQKWRWKRVLKGEDGKEQEIDLIEEWCQKWWHGDREE